MRGWAAIIGVAIAAAAPAGAQTLPSDADKLCRIPVTIIQRREVLPGARDIQPLESEARAAWATVNMALSDGRRDQAQAAYPRYLSLRGRFDRAVAPLIDTIEPSEDGVRQFAQADGMVGPFARCLEADGQRSAIATGLRRKAEQLAPAARLLWQRAGAEARDDKDFRERVKLFSGSQFLNETPALRDVAAAGLRRRDAATAQAMADTRARRAEEDAAFRRAEAAKRAAAAAAAAEVAGREPARLAAERRGRAARLPVASFAVFGGTLGFYPSPDALRASAERAFDCPAVLPFKLTDSGTGGNRVLRAGCSALGLLGGSLSAAYTLKDYRLVRIRQILPAGDFDNCFTIDGERARTSFATRAREFARAGWKLVAEKSIPTENMLGMRMTPFRWQVYRRGNVTLDLWESDQRRVDTGRCVHADFNDREVSAAYSLEGSGASPER